MKRYVESDDDERWVGDMPGGTDNYMTGSLTPHAVMIQ